MFKVDFYFFFLRIRPVSEAKLTSEWKNDDITFCLSQQLRQIQQCWEHKEAYRLWMHVMTLDWEMFLTLIYFEKNSFKLKQEYDFGRSGFTP